MKSEMLDDLMICSERYALGRRTYIVSTINKYIRGNIKKLSDRAIGCIERDIRERKNDPFCNSYGDECDETDWMTTLNILQEEMRSRNIVPWQ